MRCGPTTARRRWPASSPASMALACITSVCTMYTGLPPRMYLVGWPPVRVGDRVMRGPAKLALIPR